MSFNITPNANKNYLAKTFQLQQKQVTKHPNADKLSLVMVDYLPIISNNPQVDEWYVYFPTESAINEDFLSFTNSFRKAEKNKNPESVGFFEDNCRVKTIKLRGEISSGYIVPLKQLENFVGKELPKEEVYFNEVEGIEIVKKYKKKYNQATVNTSSSKTDKKAAKVNIVEGQFQFHESTDNLRKELHKLYPTDLINVSYKTHGTSQISANLLFNKLKKLNKIKQIWYKLLKKELPTEQVYDYVASSRKVIKLGNDGNPGYYNEDIWTHALESFKERIPKGWTIYSELMGYLPSGNYIQNEYDYGCKKGTYKIMPYRITVTDKDGNVVELSPEQIVKWSKDNGLEPMYIFYTGTVLDHYKQLLVKHPNKDAKSALELYEAAEKAQKEDYESYKETLNTFRGFYLRMLEAEYNEKDCYMCTSKVPEEGIIIRKLGHIDKFEAYKLKSKRFLEKESKEADKDTGNIEDEQS